MPYINQVEISGNVAKVGISTTSSGAKAAYFDVAIDSGPGYDPAFMMTNTVWIRVNCYNKVAEIVEKNLEKGDYVIVFGRLMSRKLKTGDCVVVEVKAKRVEIIKKQHRIKVSQ